MTTTVTVKPTGHPVLVSLDNWYRSPSGLHSGQQFQEVLLPAYAYNDKNEWSRTTSPEQKEFTITTSQTINVVDLEPDDDRVLEARGIPMKDWPKHKKDYAPPQPPSDPYPSAGKFPDD